MYPEYEIKMMIIKLSDTADRIWYRRTLLLQLYVGVGFMLWENG